VFLTRPQALPDLESAAEPARDIIIHRDVIDTGAGGPPPKSVRESVKRLALALRCPFDVAVGRVSHPAAQTFRLGRPEHEDPKADTLHAAGDAKAARHDHTVT
jgi:hypothetical protein